MKQIEIAAPKTLAQTYLASVADSTKKTIKVRSGLKAGREFIH